MDAVFSQIKVRNTQLLHNFVIRVALCNLLIKIRYKLLGGLRDMNTASPTQQTGQLAGVPRRSAAFLLDYLLMLITLATIHAGIYFSGLNPILNGALSVTGVNMHLWVFFSATLPILLYFWLFFRHGETPGMRLFGLQVRKKDRTMLSAWQALGRAVVLLIPFEINHVIWFYPQPAWLDKPPDFRMAALIVYALLAIYLVVSLLNTKRQSVHDFVAGSIVVRV